ncbi:MAG TPA: OsmC family protein [Spirochaetia bacterium]|nr:OsmC family protein [Spirochaetia bacterium]
MAEPLEVTVNLTNEKVQFAGVSSSNPDSPITFDYMPPIGDGQGYTGLELLLMSFTGCIATTVLYLLRRMGKNIAGFKVNAKGIRAEQPPLRLEKVFFGFTLNSKDTGDADIERAIQLAEESFCPVWQMAKNNVEIVTGYRIVAS